MNKDVTRQVANVVALLGTLVVNFLANALPLNGLTTGEISDRLPVYFVPAGYTFSIWGIIYLGLIGFAVFQALPSQRQSPHLRRLGYFFVLSCLANVAWLFLWHYLVLPLTLVAMVALLVLLILTYLRLGKNVIDVTATEKWLLQVPFSIYLGWISVATIANASSVLYSLGWGGWGISEPVWAVIMLVVATVITLTMLVIRRDVAYAAVIVWAFVGIMAGQSDTLLVAAPAGLMAGVVLGAALLTVFGRKRKVTYRCAF